MHHCRIAGLIGLVCIVFFFSISCTRKSDGNDKYSNDQSKEKVLIDKVGSFSSKTGKYKLIVDIKKNSIVQYKVIGHDLNKVLFIDDGGSVYQRWYFVWDNLDNLWVHSSDIGSCVWSKNKDEPWLKSRIEKDSSLFKQMPKEFSANLPNTLKRIWGIEENERGQTLNSEYE